MKLPDTDGNGVWSVHIYTQALCILFDFTMKESLFIIDLHATLIKGIC